ncbi:MAG: DMT family transporter [Anaerolineales bacterium]|nr:DMT family transporter [Anaerolineales bacterium]
MNFDRDRVHRPDRKGIAFAVTSAVMLGLTPVFGKQAILAGLEPLTTVALRTIGAAALLFIVLILFRRQFFYIYPVGLAGCGLAGALNGLGSVFFYAGLGRIDASLGQFLFTLYPIFVAGLMFLDGQRTSRLTFLRLVISVIGVLLLTRKHNGVIDPLGVFLMLMAALLYALHIPINQRVLYEVPAPTVTFYTLISMTLVVIPVKLVATGLDFTPPPAAVQPVLFLTLVTFFSRIALFAGVKAIGGVQTAIIGLLELLVTVVLAMILLNETLSLRQWLGALLLMATLLLAAFEPRAQTSRSNRGWLHWLRPPVVRTNGQNLTTPEEGSETG